MIKMQKYFPSLYVLMLVKMLKNGQKSQKTQKTFGGKGPSSRYHKFRPFPEQNHSLYISQ